MRFEVAAVLIASASSASAAFFCKIPGFKHGTIGYGGNCKPEELASCRTSVKAGEWPACANNKPHVQCWVKLYDNNTKRDTDCYYWDGAF
ncbi:hypothetical protein CTRI78_v000617 [Colletotrichum trifolii]|uniref:Secreted protein n=1 Tax=Colletotrichum trifolii TaxID=5466 RepID=A0A4R8RRT2_COLTR|nr:hypothetical protein CTRI78_v000617 [Colletotrichum trifolii]